MALRRRFYSTSFVSLLTHFSLLYLDIPAVLLKHQEKPLIFVLVLIFPSLIVIPVHFYLNSTTIWCTLIFYFYLFIYWKLFSWPEGSKGQGKGVVLIVLYWSTINFPITTSRTVTNVDCDRNENRFQMHALFIYYFK